MTEQHCRNVQNSIAVHNRQRTANGNCQRAKEIIAVLEARA
ncbi:MULTISPECIES: hypothetical protein [Xenorhabdus]|nr:MULTISPECIES: hypothetical protein [Xenorhabdus]WFQ78848.1 hypothetical protein PXH59_14485 [Xenorhabdus sp. SF857]WFQ80029.1 hypothetical protein PXH59_02230 [Xenorhabdus sp. SF857]WFQ80907.1 hypothetical protein PXH59_07355 [Xenorhabdus sp. SF857]